jgi:hypothetical protein
LKKSPCFLSVSILTALPPFPIRLWTGLVTNPWIVETHLLGFRVSMFL